VAVGRVRVFVARVAAARGRAAPAAFAPAPAHCGTATETRLLDDREHVTVYAAAAAAAAKHGCRYDTIRDAILTCARKST